MPAEAALEATQTAKFNELRVSGYPHDEKDAVKVKNKELLPLKTAKVSLGEHHVSSSN
jgi:hypothetical protein